MSSGSVKRMLRKGFTIKIILGENVYSVGVSSIIAVLLILLVVACGWEAKHLYDSRVTSYKTSIAELEQANSQYRTALALKEREKEQMAALAEERFDELCSQLDHQDKKISAIGSAVGKGKSSKGRKALRGSRSGSRHTAIAIKLKYKRLISAVENRDVDITSLRGAVATYKARVARERAMARMESRPSCWPVAGEITSDYGYRTHPVYGYARLHTGLDIGAASGTPVHATAAGTVIESGWMGGYGNAVIIQHRNGLSTLYGHCSSLAARVGQTVHKGDVIAYVGSTGVSTGPHLHYEVRSNGQHISPLPYLSLGK